MSKFKMALNKRQWMVTMLVIMIIIVVFAWSKFNFVGKNRLISDFDIQLDADSTAQFLSTDEVKDYIQSKTGRIIGLPASAVSLTKIEIELNKLPFIQKATVYVAFDGKLKVQIQERRPIIEIINRNGEIFYLDSFGYQIPDKVNVQPDVIVANGEINIKRTEGKISTLPIAVELLTMAKYIRNHPFWDQQFEQCYVDKYKGLILIPRVGKHSIVLDNTLEMHKKLENLRLFYKKGLQTVGWNTYREIDISVPNQVIGCRAEQQTEQQKEETVHK